MLSQLPTIFSSYFGGKLVVFFELADVSVYLVICGGLFFTSMRED